MGVPVMIMGPSGSGKSTSLRNFDDGEIGILNVASKPLPFRKKLSKVDNATYGTIQKALSKKTLRAYVIDDSQYLMAFGMFDRAKEVGYGKFTDIAVDFRNMLQYIITQTPPDTIVYFLHHTEMDDSGHIKAKTSGKMLDQQLTLEGLFSIVLLSQKTDAGYKFITQSDGYTTAKSPMDMFDLEIDNDLKIVDTTIREYWGMAPLKHQEGVDKQ